MYLGGRTGLNRAHNQFVRPCFGTQSNPQQFQIAYSPCLTWAVESSLLYASNLFRWDTGYQRVQLEVEIQRRPPLFDASVARFQPDCTLYYPPQCSGKGYPLAILNILESDEITPQRWCYVVRQHRLKNIQPLLRPTRLHMCEWSLLRQEWPRYGL